MFLTDEFIAWRKTVLRWLRKHRREACFLIIGFLILPRSISGIFANLGSLIMSQSLLSHDVRYPCLEMNRIPVLNSAQQAYEARLFLDARNSAGQCGLRQAALATVESARPSAVSSDFTNGDIANPLLYQDIVTALSNGGREKEAITLYENTNLPCQTQAISDAIDPTYLKQDDLGKLYHRRGELEEAKGIYLPILKVEPIYAQNYFQLEKFTEQQANLEKAAIWYQRYHRQVPGDLLGCRKLYEICKLLDERNLETILCLGIDVETNGYISSSSCTDKSAKLVHSWNFEDARPMSNFDDNLAFFDGDSLIAFEGTKSGSVVGFGAEYNAGHSMTRRVEIKPGATYLFRGYFQTRAWAEFKAKVLYWGSYGERIGWTGGGQQRIVKESTGGWTYVELTFTPPKKPILCMYVLCLLTDKDKAGLTMSSCIC
jgi:tetratricopeptide (TPR) repeat protein